MRKLRPSWVKGALGLVLLLAVCWLGGDFVYSRIVSRRIDRWERSIERDAEGVRAGCREYTVGEGDKALLLIHGFNDSPAVFSRMAARLAGRGFVCRVMRMPGSAVSVERYARATREQWKRALDDELRALSARHDSVGIVAHSLGGTLSIDYLLDHPDDASGVALLAPLIAVSGERSPLLEPRTWHAVARRLLFFTRVIDNPFPPDAHTAEARAYDRYSRFVPTRIFGEVFALLDDVAERAGELRVPVLMVLADEDRVIDSEAAEAFFRRCPVSRKRLVKIEGAGHLLPLDNGWRRVADEITAFFESSAGVSSEKLSGRKPEASIRGGAPPLFPEETSR